MFDEHDAETGFAVGFALAVAIFIALFTVGVALFVTKPPRPASAAAAAAALAPLNVYFDSGKDRMPDEAAARLASLLAPARADPGRQIVISGYYEASGDPSFNAELARQRAYAVRDFFRAAGIAEERLVLDEPQQAADDPDDREARRVEVVLQ